MDGKDIDLLIEILKHKGRGDLGNLLIGSKSEIDESRQFGSNWGAVISSFIIYSPIKNFYALRNLNEADNMVLLAGVLDLYPHEADAPEIVDVGFRILRDTDAADSNSSKPTGSKTGVDIFISYSTDDKEIAGEIKSALSAAGFTAFLAHEDIRPSSEWVDVIIDNLGSTDIFIPLVTESFFKSEWTAQEAGYALAKDKLIIPVAINGHNPAGFIGRFQSLRLDSSKPQEESSKIIETIAEQGQKHNFKYRLIDLLIERLQESPSYDSAGTRALHLTYIKDLDTDQVNKTFEAICENSQIYESRSASPYVKKLYGLHKDKISEKNLEKLKKKKPALFPNEVDTPF